MQKAVLSFALLGFVIGFVIASGLPALAAKPVIFSGESQVKLQKYGGDPKGPDPHGPDPRDEQHDDALPANRDRDQGRAPRDVYGDQFPNSRAPY